MVIRPPQRADDDQPVNIREYLTPDHAAMHTPKHAVVLFRKIKQLVNLASIKFFAQHDHSIISEGVET